VSAQQKTIDPSELELKRYEQVHNTYIKQIQKLDERMDELAPYEIAKLEYLYTKAERMAWNIAGWYKKKYKYYEGLAEIYQGQEYKNIRQDKDNTSVDAQYASRITKGNMLCEAANYEGDYITWKGIAQTYERAANALKDVMKAIEKQGGE
jgi:intein/homing endonuclease